MPAELDNLDIRTASVIDATFSLLWSRRRWIAVFCLIGGAVGAALSFIFTPIYEATIVIAPVQQNRSTSLENTVSQLGEFASLLGAPLGGNSTNQSVNLALLTSRKFTESFIARHNL